MCGNDVCLLYSWLISSFHGALLHGLLFFLWFTCTTVALYVSPLGVATVVGHCTAVCDVLTSASDNPPSTDMTCYWSNAVGICLRPARLSVISIFVSKARHSDCNSHRLE